MTLNLMVVHQDAVLNVMGVIPAIVARHFVTSTNISNIDWMLESKRIIVVND